jgi:hypothetical protein
MALPGTIKPTRFTDAAPGSRIRLYDVHSLYEPYEAVVTELIPEYGPHRIPALYVQTADSDEPRLIMGNGQTRIDIILDARKIMREEAPANAMQVRSRPQVFSCLQFEGGQRSAIEIITWAAGKAQVKWERGEGSDMEHLTLSFIDGDQRVNVGDFVMEDEKHRFSVARGDTLVEQFELLT